MRLDQIKALESETPNGKAIIVKYRDTDGYLMRGKLLTAYTSLGGKECAQIDNFGHFIYCNQIISAYYE